MNSMMKRAFLILISLMALCACESTKPVSDAPVTDATEGMTAKPQNYVALPGQAATASTVSDTTRAFEYAAAAYAQSAQQQADTAPPIPDPRPEPTSDLLSSTTTTSATTAPAPAGSGAPYALQLTNGTSNRLYIEAQDEGNNIFPFGFMHSGQRISAQPQESRPIQGRLIIVVRDPDRRGAPELRRIYVEPPPHYEGKTLGVTVLPGGSYRVSLDGVLYYSYPEPTSAA